MNAALAADLLSRHPAAPALRRLFPSPAAPPVAPSGWKPSGLRRADYLRLIAGNVDFWKGHQNAAGAIIDPYEKKERQYSTPAFAQAAATLAAHANRNDLLEPATRAFSFALAALSNNTTADRHADFYIPMLMHAHRILAPRAGPEVRARWAQQLQSLVPEKTYRDKTGGGNWNIVNVAGEALRRKDGLVAPDQLEAQMAYVERCLERQQRLLTPFGMYHDANVPLAYDAFPRLWLDDMIADNAYHGAYRQRLFDFLATGGLSTLLLLSPSGEWASGGRSAHHQWNEAEVAVICEVNARRWMGMGRPDIAGAFKRAARLALTSMRRWQRPSGEMWIVKNRADPARRHGYEGYSFHSQYNLLAVAMLAIAFERADDSIAERAIPAEIGGYVFDVRQPFHKIVGCAGGTYVLIDTGADPTHDATGLLRVHKAGVALSPLTSNAAPDRYQGPKDETIKIGMSPGLLWKNSADETDWHSLAETHHRTLSKGSPPLVEQDDLTIHRESPQQVVFSVRYVLRGAGLRPIEEDYTVTTAGIEVVTRLGGDSAPARTRLLFPALVSDGLNDTDISIEGARLTIRRHGGTLIWEALSPPGLRAVLEGPRVATRNGYAQALVADLPPGTREARWRVQLEPDVSLPPREARTAMSRRR